MVKKEKLKVVVCKNGPYNVIGNIPITKEIITYDNEGSSLDWKKGKNYPNPKGCNLCRCGGSENKPFCDGTHIKVEFDGTEKAARTTYNKMAEKIKGHGLVLTDASVFCSSARFCHRQGGTWELTSKSSDPKSKALAIDEACKCPSGRLVAWDIKGGKAIEPKFDKSIGLVEDPLAGVSGPLWLRGGIAIESSDGYGYEVRNRMTLCRCGKSNNKPFCDGSHIRVGFNDGDSSLKRRPKS